MPVKTFDVVVDEMTSIDTTPGKLTFEREQRATTVKARTHYEAAKLADEKFNPTNNDAILLTVLERGSYKRSNKKIARHIQARRNSPSSRARAVLAERRARARGRVTDPAMIMLPKRFIKGMQADATRFMRRTPVLGIHPAEQEATFKITSTALKGFPINSHEGLPSEVLEIREATSTFELGSRPQQAPYNAAVTMHPRRGLGFKYKVEQISDTYDRKPVTLDDIREMHRAG